MTTLDDVARAAGVSRMTASNALRGKSVVRASTAAKVLKAAKKLNYQPNLAARQLSSGRTNVIGFSTVELDNSPFSSDLASAVSDLAVQKGYQTLIQQTRYSTAYESSMLSAVSTQFTDGMILCAPSVSEETIRQVNEKYPLVVFDASFENYDAIDRVLTPCEEGAFAATSHLIDQGCERILVLGAYWHDDDELAHTVTSDGKRLRGVANALSAHGMTLQRELVHRCGWNMDDGYRTMQQLLDDGLSFDGLFCLTDVIAIGAMRALIERGLRIPQDVAVVGFDGLPSGKFLNPPLSSVVIDPKDVAQECLTLLLDRIDSPDDHEFSCRTVPFSLRVGDSSRRS
ncbi:transcriptional regulator, LacI family [Bifidobacterium goeldii]|uniref:Transcriptional regulator, LacI family n=1 Tax=Bifidobacterium goeldii TaxID=2306975 RepID=A0A430FKY9_9BIFI|nr:LacI family DNA-binding transcriptional regulator [Bifidobacterium goeldii]RSX53559.1 transcriptional regulator, LacI family [Bifidobacterium goeldii]